MKKTVMSFATVIAAATVAVCSPVRSNLGGEATTENIELPTYTAADYIQDGLIAIWDGIENSDWGVHDPDAKVWRNLVKGDAFPIKAANYFEPDGLVTVEQTAWNSVPMYDLHDYDEYTIEVCGASLEKGTSLVSLPYADPGVRFMPYAVWDSSNNSYIKACGNILFLHNTGPVGTPKCFGVSVSGNFFEIYSVQFGASKTGTWTKATNRYNGYIPKGVKDCCIRYYNRALSTEEVAHNYLIDCFRFNLP